MSIDFKPDSNFVWTDLSSYDTSASRQFYEAVFGWSFYDAGKASAEPDDRFGMHEVSYHFATLKDQPAAGVFDMPPFFQKIKMPPFWMSYLSVDDLAELVARAKMVEGVVVDVEPTPFGEGMMALIRDPLGAGFTCYEGPDIDSKGDGSEYGRMVWNELITEDISAVAPFYRDVLGFQVVPDPNYEGERVKLLNASGTEVAGIQAVDQSMRSSKVYWMPFFSIDDLASFRQRIADAGGKVMTETDDGHGDASALCFDNTGAAFGVAQTGAPYGDITPWYRMFF